MRDYQRSRCYRWEREGSWWGRSVRELALNQVIYIVRYLDWKVRQMPAKKRPEVFNDQLCYNPTQNTYKTNEYYYQNRVRFVKNARTATSATVGPVFENGKDKFIYEIKIPVAWATNWEVVLHEFAHSLCGGYEGHGPTWVSTYCVLLYYFHPSQPTLKELTESLNRRGVNYDSITSNPWFMGFARVKIDINKAPAFTNLVKKAWGVKKRKPNVNKGKKNYKSRVTNLIKKYPFLWLDTDDLSTESYTQWDREFIGTGTVWVFSRFYRETSSGHQLDQDYFGAFTCLSSEEIKDYLKDPYSEHYLDIDGDTFELKQECWKEVYERCQNYIEIYQDLTQTIG